MSPFIGAKDDEGGGDNWSYKTCAKLQSNRHHQHTITQHLTGRMLFLSPKQQRETTEGRSEHWREIGALKG